MKIPKDSRSRQIPAGADRGFTAESRVMLGGSAVLILVQAWASFTPLHANWGFHLFAFYPSWFGLLALCCCAALLHPRLGSIAQASLQKGTGLLQSVHPMVLFLALALVFLVSADYFSARAHLLGDGMLLLELTPKSPGVADASANFRNQPLTYFCIRSVQGLLGSGRPVEPIEVYRVIDKVAGVLYIGVVIWFVSLLRLKPPEKVLLGCFFLLSPGIQFYFGYVENYSLLATATAAFFATAWMALEKRAPIIAPFLLFPVMAGLHLGAVVFSPALLYLLAHVWRRRPPRHAFLIAAATGAGIAGLFLLNHYTPGQFAVRMIEALRYDFLPLVTASPGGVPYGIFSSAHLLDWINAAAHIMPFAALIAGALLPLAVRRYGRQSPLLRFLLLGAATGLVFSFVVNPALGMARDWDFLSVYFLPVRFLAAAALIPYFEVKGARRIITAVMLLAIVHTAAWVGLNADEEKHLRRAELLTDPELSGTFPKTYYENLGVTFYHKGDYARAARWYEHYMAIDSMNPRIIQNLSESYKHLGDEEKGFHMLERAVAAGNSNPAVYSNLGIQYALRGDTARAISTLSRALAVDSNFSRAAAGLAVLLYPQHQDAQVVRYASRAIDLGLADPALFRLAGAALVRLGRFGEALAFYDRLLALDPADSATRSIREHLLLAPGRTR